MNDTSTPTPATAAAIYGWAILEMHPSQMRTMVRGMASTEAAAWREAFGPTNKGRAPKGSWARAEALSQEEWHYWQQYY